MAPTRKKKNSVHTLYNDYVKLAFLSVFSDRVFKIINIVSVFIDHISKNGKIVIHILKVIK